MPRAKKRKHWSPGFTLPRSKDLALNREDLKELPRILNIEEKQHNAFWRDLTGCYRLYFGCLHEDDEPSPASRREELVSLGKALRRAGFQLGHLSDLAKRDLIRTDFNRADQEEWLQFPREAVWSIEKNETLIREAFGEIMNLYQFVMKTIVYLEQQKSVGAPRKYTLTRLILRLNDIFRNHYQSDPADGESSNAAKDEFIKTALKAANIRPPRHLSYYLPPRKLRS